jgi:hypothetical protein
MQEENEELRGMLLNKDSDLENAQNMIRELQ